ncbi:S1C family serine protease [Candidatus Zixiibacteriota bacterium]
MNYDPCPERPPAHPPSKIYGILAIIIFGLLLGVVLLKAVPWSPSELSLIPRPTLAKISTDLSSADATAEITNTRRNAIVRAAEQVGPAVVSISVTQVRIVTSSPFGRMFRDPLFEYFFPEMRREYRQNVKSMGSGFLIDDDGHVLTNWHVVQNASQIVVNLADGRQFQGELVGSDPALDLALLKIEGNDLPAASLGDSDDLIIGEWVIAIGNPYGYVLKDSRPSVTVGVISATGRDFDPQEGRVYRNMIQTDAAINSGNSGGPLINSVGQVIGINTFIFTKSGGSLGIGFAIPINTAKRMWEEIVQYGEVRPFWTGIHIQSLSPLIAQSLSYPSTDGVIVSQLDSASPALRAGLLVGDIITGINGKGIRDENDLVAEFYGTHVGDEITLDVWREGQAKTVSFTLVEPEERG